VLRDEPFDAHGHHADPREVSRDVMPLRDHLALRRSSRASRDARPSSIVAARHAVDCVMRRRLRSRCGAARARDPSSARRPAWR